MTRLPAAGVIVGLLALAGCASRPVSAPVTDRTPPAQAAQRTPQEPVAAGSYVVKKGDTLYAIALEHGLDYRELAQWNRLDDPSRIREGQALRLGDPRAAAATGKSSGQQQEPVVSVGAVNRPASVGSRPLDAGRESGAAGGAAGRGVAAGGIPTKTEPKAQRLPYTKENLALLAREEQVPPAAATKAPPQAAPAPAAQQATRVEPRPEHRPEGETVSFSWPARGKVIAGFSEPGNKGVDIDGKPGDPVLAAAPGRVMYTGTGIRGYGKLIVIKHDDGYNSVYAHNREILVKEGQPVTRGERIAELGDTDAERPKLHFEIRKSGKPVDPAKFLEAR